MLDDISKVIVPSAPAPTIGDRGVRLHHSPIRRRIDFYDTAGRAHMLIALLPIIYGILQAQRGEQLQPWYWWMVIATVCFALFVRRASYLRLTSAGLCFPEKKSAIYSWDQMSEAHARTDELDILLANGDHVIISYRSLRKRDVNRLKKLVKSQFQFMAQRAKAADVAVGQAA